MKSDPIAEKYPHLMAADVEPTTETQADVERRQRAAERAERQSLLRKFFDNDENGRRVYGECSLDGFEAPVSGLKAEVLNAMLEYSESITERIANREGLLLYGPCGTGKDHLAIAVCLSAIRNHGLSAIRVNGSDWFGEIRDSMDNENAPSERSMIGRLGAPDLLLISDPLPPIGNLSQHQATMLYRLVERRYFTGKITLVTVNVADDEEAEIRMGVPTWDRLRHRAWVARCYWETYRKPAREIGKKK